MKKLFFILSLWLIGGQIKAQIVPPMAGQVINTKIVDPTHLQIRFRSNAGFTFASIEAGDIYAVKSGPNIVRYFISSTSTAGFHPSFDGTIAITPLDGYSGDIPTATPTASGYIYRPIGGIAPLEYLNQDYSNWAMVNWNLQSLSDSIGAGGGLETLYYGNVPLTNGDTISVDGRPYKVYTALLSQGGTGNPTAIVFENTLGATITWDRATSGNYRGYLSSGVLTLGKVYATANIGDPTSASPGYFAFLDGNFSGPSMVYLRYQDITGNPIDNFDYMSIEIRVYP